MTEKRFEAKSIPVDPLADRVIGVFDEGTLINNFAVVRILNELYEENQQLKSNEDEFIELNHIQLLKINKLRKKLIREKEKHQEDKFKLQTLEKFYKCPNCSFNGKEMKYLKELRE